MSIKERGIDRSSGMSAVQAVLLSFGLNDINVGKHILCSVRDGADPGDVVDHAVCSPVMIGSHEGEVLQTAQFDPFRTMPVIEGRIAEEFLTGISPASVRAGKNRFRFAAAIV